MMKRSIFKKLQAAILALAISISILAAGGTYSFASSVENVAYYKNSQLSETGISASSKEDVSDRAEWSTKKPVIETQGNCDFHAFLSTDGKESWIYKVEIHKDGLKKLSFPSKVKDAPVTRIGYGAELYSKDADFYYTIFNNVLEPWHNCYDTDKKADNITTIEFPATLTRIEAGAFCGFKKLKKVEIPNGVKELTPYSFAACPKLTEVKLPAELTTLNVKAFDKSNAISKLTISQKSKKFITKNGFLLSKNSKSLIWAAPAMTEVIIPKGVAKLEDNALFATNATKVVIPKSVCDIGSRALSGKNIKKIVLKKGNKVFEMDGTCIYNKSDKSLAAILVKKGRAQISFKVKILGEGISVMGDYIERVDIPKSVNKVIENWMFFSDLEEDTMAKVYFHGTKPPKIVSKVPGYVYTALPIWNEVYVPKKAKNVYIRWANDRDGLEWYKLKTF